MHFQTAKHHTKALADTWHSEYGCDLQLVTDEVKWNECNRMQMVKQVWSCFCRELLLHLSLLSWSVKIIINNGFLMLFLLITLSNYTADLPHGRGRLTLRKNLTLSQIPPQWTAFAQSRDAADARFLQACFPAN